MIHATPHTSLDLTPILQDRFEQNCAIGQQFDFYTHDEMQVILMNQVVKDEVEEQAAYVSKNFSLKIRLTGD